MIKIGEIYQTEYLKHGFAKSNCFKRDRMGGVLSYIDIGVINDGDIVVIIDTVTSSMYLVYSLRSDFFLVENPTYLKKIEQ